MADDGNNIVPALMRENKMHGDEDDEVTLGISSNPLSGNDDDVERLGDASDLKFWMDSTKKELFIKLVNRYSDDGTSTILLSDVLILVREIMSDNDPLLNLPNGTLEKFEASVQKSLMKDETCRINSDDVWTLICTLGRKSTISPSNSPGRLIDRAIQNHRQSKQTSAETTPNKETHQEATTSQESTPRSTNASPLQPPNSFGRERTTPLMSTSTSRSAASLRIAKSRSASFTTQSSTPQSSNSKKIQTPNLRRAQSISVGLAADGDLHRDMADSDVFFTPRSSLRSLNDSFDQSEDGTSNKEPPYLSPGRKLFSSAPFDSEAELEIQMLSSKIMELSRQVQERDRKLANVSKHSESQIQDLLHQTELLQADISGKKRTIAELKSAEKDYKMQIAGLESHETMLTKDLADARIFCAQLKTQLEKQTAHERHLKEGLSLKAEEMQASENDLQSLRMELKRAQDDKLRLQQNVEQLTGFMEATDAMIATLKSDNQFLKESLDALRSSMNEAAAIAPASEVEVELEVTIRQKTLKSELADSAYDSESCVDDDVNSFFSQRRRQPLVENSSQTLTTLSNNSCQTIITEFVSSESQTQISTSAEATQTEFQLQLSHTAMHMDIYEPRKFNEEATQCAVATLARGAQTDESSLLGHPREAIVMVSKEIQTADVETPAAQPIEFEDDQRTEFMSEKLSRICEIIPELEETMGLIENRNATLRKEVNDLQSLVLKYRKELSLRRHFDKEIERWVQNVGVNLGSVEALVANCTEALQQRNELIQSLRLSHGQLYSKEYKDDATSPMLAPPTYSAHDVVDEWSDVEVPSSTSLKVIPTSMNNKEHSKENKRARVKYLLRVVPWVLTVYFMSTSMIDCYKSHKLREFSFGADVNHLCYGIPPSNQLRHSHSRDNVIGRPQ